MRSFFYKKTTSYKTSGMYRIEYVGEYLRIKTNIYVNHITYFNAKQIKNAIFK